MECSMILMESKIGSAKKEIVHFDVVYREWKEGRITAVRAIELLNVSKTTFYRRVKEMMQMEKEFALERKRNWREWE